MKSSGKNLSLTSYDDIFKSTDTTEISPQESVVDIQLADLHPFKNHPFKVIDDAAMLETVDSIIKYGILVPIIARPRAEGGYELISGHRRKRACELAGLETLPVIVRNLDDDAATIIMVDSNIQRENILPSERAFAYKLKLEAMDRQLGRPSQNNEGQLVPHFQGKRSTEIIGEQSGESGRQIQRYIRLTELLPDLLDMVDNKIIAFNPAVELSYLSKKEQQELMEVMEMEQSTPSLSQAQRLKKFSQEDKLTPDLMTSIMSEEKKPDIDKVTLTSKKLQQYFPKSYTPKQMEETILKLLEGWAKKRQQSHER